jgi:hypothetical protein
MKKDKEIMTWQTSIAEAGFQQFSGAVAGTAR